MDKALIVIDVQTKYMDKYDSNLINRINERIREAKAEELSIIYVKNTGNPGNEAEYTLADELLMESDDVYEKRFPSAFTSKEFVERLQGLGLKELELIGVDGSSCVAKTAFDGVARGYDVTVNLRCVSSVNDKIFAEVIDKMKAEGIKTSDK